MEFFSQQIHSPQLDKYVCLRLIRFILQQLEIKDFDTINITIIKKRLVDRYEIFCLSKVSENAKSEGKLRTYFQFKSIFKREPYLNIIKDVESRQNLTRFRTSAHDLKMDIIYRNIIKGK